MDYSAASADFEQPGGSSPWASTSPRVDQSDLSNNSAKPPSTPSRPQQDSNHDPNRESHLDSKFSTNSIDASSSPTTNKEAENGSPDLSERLQSPQWGDPDYVGEQGTGPYNPGPVQQASSRSQNQRPARYHSGQRTTSARPVPAYKLQTKITALERTGRKDPVLRFDAYVGQHCL